MFDLKEFKRAASLEQAHEWLLADKKNIILGGTLWMRLGRQRFRAGIDLSGLDLDRIAETDAHIEIGCCTTLRQMETSPVLAHWFGDLFARALAPVVGVQFRNCATVGGSVYPRLAFSDVITALLALETDVVLFRGGALPLETFLETGGDRDILVKLRIRKQQTRTAYQSMRKAATDFPVLACGVGRTGNRWRIALGARPARAKRAVEAAAMLGETPSDREILAACAHAVSELDFGTNQRGSRAYREAVAPVLIKRGIESICR